MVVAHAQPGRMWILGEIMAVSSEAASSQHVVAHLNETSQYSGIVVFLHGAGDTGPGVELWTRNVMSKGNHSSPTLVFPHIKISYPTASKRKYTAGGGYPTTVWFDWPKIDPAIPEDRESIDPVCQWLCSFIDGLIAEGTPSHRIILGGLSMGGVLALHVAYRFKKDLAGVFALSSFLHDETIVYENLKDLGPGQSLPPLFFAHGMKDTLIRHEWGQTTFDKLRGFGIDGTFHSYHNLQHAMNGEELEALKSWIIDTLPEY